MKLKKILLSWAKATYRYIRNNMPSGKKAVDKSMEIQERVKRSGALLKTLYDGNIITILNGPFMGLRYIDSSNGSQLFPKLIGSYEEPIQKWIHEVMEWGEYATIIDVGCAEGYYAVGFSRAKSKPRILAFDIDKDALENAKKLAFINGASDVVSFYELFKPSTVSTLLKNDPANKILIFMDIEGAEIDLLNADETPDILSCDILVELHDCFHPGLTEKIIEKFQETHMIEITVDYPWRLNNYSLNGRDFSEEDKQYMFDERRPKAMRWMYARKK